MPEKNGCGPSIPTRKMDVHDPNAEDGCPRPIVHDQSRTSTINRQRWMSTIKPNTLKPHDQPSSMKLKVSDLGICSANARTVPLVACKGRLKQVDTGAAPVRMVSKA